MIVVKSILPLSDAELTRITEIFEDEDRPLVALREMLPGHIIFEDSVVYVGSHSHDYTYEIYPRED